MTDPRWKRFWDSDHPKDPPDPRSPSQRDRDRVLYTPQFRRLADVTQVVASQEVDLFHNRLTHTLEVAQIGRRIAERLADAGHTTIVDADVVETAALAHDIGHPPFGHIAEAKLDALLIGALPDGFEGNAQSFRVITKLARRSNKHPGLDLTRASLQGVSKYPWGRQSSGKRHRKYGHFASEKQDFDWSRQELSHAIDEQTVEAAIMDWADDVAYALHDVDDFFSAGLVPLDRLARDEREQSYFLERTFERWVAESRDLLGSRADYERAASILFAEFPTEPWQSSSARTIMPLMVGQKINSYVTGLSIQEGRPSEDPDMRREIDLLKSLTWTYVIEAPALAAQQAGQRRIIETLFEYFRECAITNVHALPGWASDYLHDDERLAAHEDSAAAQARIACDVVASLSERQAQTLFLRLTGHDAGNVTSSIVR